MTFTLVWQPAAVAGLVRLRAEDGQAAKTVRAAVAALADNPLPPRSSALGTEGLRRLRVGNVRVLYNLDGDAGAVHILTVGRVPS